jgi:hypothetical protein
MLVATFREHGPAPAPGRVMLASARSSVPLARERAPIPQGRPFSRGDDDAPPQTDERPEVVTVADEAPRARRRELTASARIERTMGPATNLAWVTGPAGVPSSGVLNASEPVAAYAPRRAGPGAELLSGRGLY